MANHWMEVAMKTPGLRVVGLTDIRRPAAEAMAKKHGLPESVVFDTLTEALDRAKPQAVFDVTVPAAHERVTVEALRAGAHVLGEKPLADSLDKARRMIAAAHEAGRIYAVIQNRRYEPNIQRVARTLRGGALGAVEEIHADFFIGAHFGGFRDEMDDPLIVDMAIHTFDAARYIGAADPVSVYCHSFNPPRSWYKGHASALAVFEMRGPGGEPIVFSYRGSWCAEGPSTSWNSAWRIVGARGTLLWDGEGNVEARAIKPGGKHAFQSEVSGVEIPGVTVEHPGHAGLIREFLDCIRTGETPQTVCDDNVKSLAMVLAAVESRKRGEKVKVEW
jgi:predicted dehydrogenase